MNLFQKLLKKQNDKYPTTPFKLGKRVVPICSHCGSFLPECRMEILPYESKTIKKLPELMFNANINGELEKNLSIQPTLHFSDMLVQRKLYRDVPVSCATCGTLHQSVVALKIFNIVVLLCM